MRLSEVERSRSRSRLLKFRSPIVRKGVMQYVTGILVKISRKSLRWVKVRLTGKVQGHSYFEFLYLRRPIEFCYNFLLNTDESQMSPIAVSDLTLSDHERLRSRSFRFLLVRTLWIIYVHVCIRSVWITFMGIYGLKTITILCCLYLQTSAINVMFKWFFMWQLEHKSLFLQSDFLSVLAVSVIFSVSDNFALVEVPYTRVKLRSRTWGTKPLSTSATTLVFGKHRKCWASQTLASISTERLVYRLRFPTGCFTHTPMGLCVFLPHVAFCLKQYYEKQQQQQQQ